MPRNRGNEHTPSCYANSFHDLRRGFATNKVGRLTPKELQVMMRHQSFTTTPLYLNMARELGGVAGKLSVPDLPDMGRLTGSSEKSVILSLSWDKHS